MTRVRKLKWVSSGNDSIGSMPALMEIGVGRCLISQGRVWFEDGSSEPADALVDVDGVSIAATYAEEKEISRQAREHHTYVYGPQLREYYNR